MYTCSCQVHLDLAFLPQGLALLELEGCAVTSSQGLGRSSCAGTAPSSSRPHFSCGGRGNGAASSSSSSNNSGSGITSNGGGTRSSSSSDACAKQVQPPAAHQAQAKLGCVLLPRLRSLSLRQCSGNAGPAFSHLRGLTSLELRRCYGLSLSLPSDGSGGSSTASVPAGPLPGVGAAGAPRAACRLPDGWLGLEMLECDSLQRLLGSFQHCCHELSRLRCVGVLGRS